MQQASWNLQVVKPSANQLLVILHLKVNDSLSFPGENITFSQSSPSTGVGQHTDGKRDTERKRSTHTKEKHTHREKKKHAQKELYTERSVKTHTHTQEIKAQTGLLTTSVGIYLEI